MLPGSAHDQGPHQFEEDRLHRPLLGGPQPDVEQSGPGAARRRGDEPRVHGDLDRRKEPPHGLAHGAEEPSGPTEVDHTVAVEIACQLLLSVAVEVEFPSGESIEGLEYPGELHVVDDRLAYHVPCVERLSRPEVGP